MVPLTQKKGVAGSKQRGSLRKPKPIGSPVLENIWPVIEKSRHMRTRVDKIVEHAGWMAYEELPVPNFTLPFGIGSDPKQAIDFILISTTINFAFTDFTTHVLFQVDYNGQHWWDADALVACMKRALDDGIPFLEGDYLRRVTRSDLEQVFQGNIELPLLDERVEILRSVGEVLTSRYGGHFHNFVSAASPRLYDGGKGMLEKLVNEFPRFNDVSTYQDNEVKFYKLAQLGIWILYASLSRSGGFRLEDPKKLTAFADYILPVALQVMKIFDYSSALEKAIQTHQLIPRDSSEEIEIRAHTIYATALLTEEVNKRRPASRQVIIPQIDARLWTHYHATFVPHHLTRTIMY